MTTGLSPRAQQLQEVADELTPVKSLTRAGDRARSTISAVTVVGAAATALGLFGLQTVPRDRVAWWLVVVGVAGTLSALLLALTHLVVTVRPVNRRDLAEVERWINGETRRMRLVAWASRALLAGAVLAVAGGLTALLTPALDAGLVVQLTAGESSRASVALTLSGGEPGGHYSIRLTQDGGSGPATILVADLLADRTGRGQVNAVVEGLEGSRAVRAEVVGPEGTILTGTAELDAP